MSPVIFHLKSNAFNEDQEFNFFLLGEQIGPFDFDNKVILNLIKL